MNIKRMTAGLMAGFLMTGVLPATCFAADTEAAEKQTAAVTENAEAASDAASDAAQAEQEKLPYEVDVDENGKLTFSFGDWKWSAEDAGQDRTDGTVSDAVNSYLNLRSGSGMEYEVIGHLLPGEKVQVVSKDGDWYQVVVPERTGYVYKDYVDILKKEQESGTVDEEFLSMMLYLMMNSINQTGTSLTPEGNLTLVDDIGASSGAGQQFITLVTKSGNYFYLIIDRNDKGEENVHLLNMVDEADLFALMDEEQVKSFQTAQDAANAEKDEAEAAPQAPSETEKPEQQKAPKAEKKAAPVLPVIGVFIILIACGGGYFMMQTKKKKAAEQRPDPDADYTEEDEGEYVLPEEYEDESYPEDDAEYMPEPEDTEE